MIDMGVVGEEGDEWMQATRSLSQKARLSATRSLIWKAFQFWGVFFTQENVNQPWLVPLTLNVCPHRPRLKPSGYKTTPRERSF
jgi:hypothetical protein